MYDMPAKETVKILLFKRDMTITTLADKLTELTGKKYTRSGLSSKISRGYLRYNEMEQIAKILEFKINFEDLTD